LANCISCGRAIEEGKFFCPDCYTSMTPDAGTQPDTSAPAAGKSVPAEAAPEPAKSSAGAKEVPRFTPPSQKRVIKSTPSSPEKKAKTARKSKERGTSQTKLAKPVKQSRLTSPGPSRGSTAGLKAKQAVGRTGRAGKRAGHRLKGTAVKTASWLKGMALESKRDFDQKDWASWGAGTAASLLLITTIILARFIRVDWILAGSDNIGTQATMLKAIELGVSGYLLVAISVILIILCGLSITSAKSKIDIKINPAFLAICISLIGLVVLVLALLSNETILHAAAKKNGWSETTELIYAKKTVQYGSYVAAICLVMVFGAAAVRLAEREASPQWIRRITSWFRVKILTVSRSGKKKGPDA
jgi:hypothetical protein